MGKKTEINDKFFVKIYKLNQFFYSLEEFFFNKLKA